MTAEDEWPNWVRPQLRHAVELAHRTSARQQQVALAPELYRSWFNPRVGPQLEVGRIGRPLAGLYRTAHAGSRARVMHDGVATVNRRDAIGRDGWWRTWGEAWRPIQSRRGSLRLIMSPRPGQLADFVETITRELLDEPMPWMLACATAPRRLGRIGGAVLHVPNTWTPLSRLITRLEPLSLPVAPPLCLPIGAGIGLADDPDNGMTFGEHRCHLIALALRPASQCGERRAPLRAIAEVFASHGVDPARPYLSPQLRAGLPSAIK